MKKLLFSMILIAGFSAKSQAQIAISPGQSIWVGNQQVTCFTDGNSSPPVQACSCLPSSAFGYKLVLNIVNSNGQTNEVVLATFRSAFPNDCQNALSKNPKCL